MKLDDALLNTRSSEGACVLNPVQKLLLVFIIFDSSIALSYGYQVLTPNAAPTNVGEILKGAVALCFALDTLLAAFLVVQFRAPLANISWEKHYTKVVVNYASNLISLLILAAQRLNQAYGHPGLIAIAIAYVTLRFAKVSSLRRLERQVAVCCAHADEPDKYDEIVEYWSKKTDSWLEKAMYRIFVVCIVIIVIMLGLACVLDALSSGNTNLAQPESTDTNFAQPLFLTSKSASDALGTTGNGATSGAAVGAGIAVAITSTADGAAVGGAIGGAVGAVVGIGVAIFGS